METRHSVHPEHGFALLASARLRESRRRCHYDGYFSESWEVPCFCAHQRLGCPLGRAQASPGKFQVVVNGKPLEHTFGTVGKEWFWEPGGEVEIHDSSVTLALRDKTGFDGRCDAIYFTKDGTAPLNDSATLPNWRRQMLGLPHAPNERGGYDLVVIGGGYSGMGAALSAARMGCKVAPIQDRPVLGGNGSSEVRVWSQGLIRRGRYPRVGEIIAEFCDNASKSPGSYEEFEDARKEAIVRAEKNIDLFLNQFAYQVDTQEGRITGVTSLDTAHQRDHTLLGKAICRLHRTWDDRVSGGSRLGDDSGRSDGHE